MEIIEFYSCKQQLLLTTVVFINCVYNKEITSNTLRHITGNLENQNVKTIETISKNDDVEIRIIGNAGKSLTDEVANFED